MGTVSLRKSFFIGLGCALSSLTGYAGDTQPAKTSIPPASHFTVATPGSKWLNVSRALTTDDLHGQIILLDFWTYCCINCLQTIPELAKLEKEFKNDLVVIGVHSAKFDNEKDTDHIRQAILRYGIEHPVVNDKDFRIWRAFEVRSWPTLVLLQPSGEVAKVVTGEGHTEELRKAIRELVKANPKRPKVNLPLELEREKVAKGEFFFPSKLAYDEASQTLFVSDSSHQQIAAYTWDPKNSSRLKPAYRIGKSGEAGFANGSFASARFRRPQGLLASKNVLYIADTENHAVRKVDLKAKTVSTVVGTGVRGSLSTGKNLVAKTTAIASPWDLAFHPDEDHLVIAMAGNHELWSLDLKAGKISIIAGSGAEGISDGLLTENTLAQPSGLSSLLGSLYFVDAESSSLRFYFEGFVRTLVGSGLFDFGFRDGERKSAKMQHPLGISADVTGVYIADTYNHSIRRYDPAKQSMETVVGDGISGEGANSGAEVAVKTRLNEPSGIVKLSEGIFAIADTNNHRLMVWNRSSGKIERMMVDGEKKPELIPGDAVAAPKKINVRLPNTLPLPEAIVNRTNPELRIILPERYKMNAEGPSFASLFEGALPRETLKQDWKREDLVKSLTLSLADLKAGQNYTFQGTFYFCLDTKNSVCNIASVSFPIRVDASGLEKIEVPIRVEPSKK